MEKLLLAFHLKNMDFQFRWKVEWALWSHRSLPWCYYSSSICCILGSYTADTEVAGAQRKLLESGHLSSGLGSLAHWREHANLVSHKLPWGCAITPQALLRREYGYRPECSVSPTPRLLSWGTSRPQLQCTKQKKLRNRTGLRLGPVFFPSSVVNALYALSTASSLWLYVLIHKMVVLFSAITAMPSRSQESPQSHSSVCPDPFLS